MESTTYVCYYRGKGYPVVTDGINLFVEIDGVMVNVGDLKGDDDEDQIA